ncbi:hypothetical protein CH251_10395 [Rhodococcus sp. 06-462-5]|nr:hypothetical protein CH251_10395 [Rhodococcus sp. 06-462-5]
MSIGIGSPSDTSFSGGGNSIEGKPGGGPTRVDVGAVDPVGCSAVVVVVVAGLATPWCESGACGPSLGSRRPTARNNPSNAATRSRRISRLTTLPRSRHTLAPRYRSLVRPTVLDT